MLLVCQEDKREEVAENIIRQTIGYSAQKEPFAREMAGGTNDGDEVILTIREPLPSVKRLTEAIEEHWKAMIHGAVEQAARQGPLPRFKKAFVELEIVTPRGSNNARLWDTSNRAINVVINNLKGIFFEDDNMEHMALCISYKRSNAFYLCCKRHELGQIVVLVPAFCYHNKISLISSHERAAQYAERVIGHETKHIDRETGAPPDGGRLDDLGILCPQPSCFSRYPSDRYAGRQPRLGRV